METINKRHPFDVATIFKEGGENFTQKYHLCPDQWRAFHAICQCRTPALGGHLDKCNTCAHQRIAYNSCRNRHCNKCQYTKQLQWVDKLRGSLPVCRYFHTCVPEYRHYGMQAYCIYSAPGFAQTVLPEPTALL